MQKAHSLRSSETGRVLIADDQTHVLEAIKMLLHGHGFATETVTHPTCVLQALQTREFDAVLMDLNYSRGTMEGHEGLELVSRVRSLDSLLPIVVMTAWSSVDLAVEAMRRGASDFIQKPWENSELVEKIQTQVLSARAQRRTQRLSDEELREARAIQDSLLPRRMPEIAGYELAATTTPLRFVGGDFYSVVQLSDRYTVLCMGDVAGKGMPAALLMSSLQAALKPLIEQRLAPSELCCRLNHVLCDLTPVGKFISFFYGVLDNVENHLTYCNAGHNPPLLVRADDTCAELNAAGAVLGQFPNWTYEQSQLRTRSGDRLLLFTDGLVEINNAEEQAFGEESLVRIARENPSSSADELMGLLMRAAAQHGGGHFQDDASLIVLKAK